jgi:hypothetical protein
MAKAMGRSGGGNVFSPGGGNGGFNPGQANTRFQAEQGTQNMDVLGTRYQLGREMAAPGQMSIPQTQFLRPQELAKGSPRGAQTIPVIGMAPQQNGGGLRLGAASQQPGAIRMTGNGFQQQGQTPVLPQRPSVPALSGPAAAHSEEVHRIEVRGMGSDGKEYAATFDAVFPRGTTMLGATEIPKE